MVVYLIIRDLESIDGPEVDVFERKEDRDAMAAILKAQYEPFVSQDQAVMGGSIAEAFLAYARSH